MLTVKEASTEMGLSPVRVRQLCQDGRIKGAVKLGGWAWMIPTPIVRYQPPRGRPPIGEPASERLALAALHREQLSSQGRVRSLARTRPQRQQRGR